MSTLEIPKLSPFIELENLLEIERRTIVKLNNFSGNDDEFVRSVEDARIVLKLVAEIQTELRSFFVKYPGLIVNFNNEFGSFSDFVERENVLNLIFLDDCLFPIKEKFYFGQDGGLNPSFFPIHVRAFGEWIKKIEEAHLASQEIIKEKFTLELKSNELPCECTQCIGDFRAKLRDFVYSGALENVEMTLARMNEDFNLGIERLSELFQDMQKELDKAFYKLRYRLRRSTLNRLESQLKGMIREKFTYSSEIGSAHARQNLRPFFENYLRQEGFPEDLLTEDEFGKYFHQLSTNLWRTETYLEREFKKFVKSIVVLKKKDVSSKILTEYLGEFWVHSSARQIERKIIYHMGPTNSGKTYHAIEALSKSEKGCYLAPLRLLAGELYDTLNAKGVKTSLLTGEEVIEVDGATHFSSTIEMARFQEIFDCCVIDEIQMISDPQRGWAWTRALVNVFSPEVHICGDSSVLDLIKNIVDLCGDKLVIKEYSRMTELLVEPRAIVLADLEKSDALIVFSRKNALRYKRDLERLGFRVSIVYGRLSPEVRREQARKFDQGETDIIVSTDAIAMGMNLPIKRIVFSTLSKFINSKEHLISISEIKQISGRAGRYLRYPIGYVSCLTRVDDGIGQIRESIQATLSQSQECMVGPDLDIFNQVNKALSDNGLPSLKLSEFLRLFNTMTFKRPFFCVDMREMIELAEMVEDTDRNESLTDAEVFGFACAPVNMGLLEHVQYFMWILSHYVSANPIRNELINHESHDIDYLETTIKCVELFQWLSRHFNNKNFEYNEYDLLGNKNKAIEKLNSLLGEKIVPTCSSCGVKLEENCKFPICDGCFKNRHTKRRSYAKSDRKNGAGRSSGPGDTGAKKTTRKRKYSPGGRR